MPDVDAAVIAPLVREFLDHLTERKVWVAKVYHKNPNRRRFHRHGCKFRARVAIQTDVSSATRDGIMPCYYCIGDLRTEWAHKLGFPVGFIDDLVAGRVRMLSNDYAARLLIGIGERPHPSLVPRQPKPKERPNWMVALDRDIAASR